MGNTAYLSTFIARNNANNDCAALAAFLLIKFQLFLRRDAYNATCGARRVSECHAPIRRSASALTSGTAPCACCRHCSRRVYVTAPCPSVCPCVYLIYRPHQQRAGLLLWARRAGYIDRQRRPPGAAAAGRTAARRSAANASSAMLSADVGS